MAKLSFDYSRFDKIEDSDDEEAHHPNLDRGLNQRVIRISRDRKEDEIDTQKAALEEAGKLEEAAKLERQRPLHVGNMSKVVEERTIINSAHGTKDRLVRDGEEFPIDELDGWTKDNEKLLEEFIDADWEKSRQLLVDHGDALLGECVDGYFLLQAIDHEMNGNTKRVEKIVNQGQLVSQIRQLASAMRRPPRDLVHRFFDRFQTDEGKKAFKEGVDTYYNHIRSRAKLRKEERAKSQAAQLMSSDSAAAREAIPLVEAMYDMEPKVRKSLAPKGLDPVKVYEALPEPLKAAFKAGSTEMLKEAAEQMKIEDFEKHFQLCIDAGLWEEELNAFVHVSAQ